MTCKPNSGIRLPQTKASTNFPAKRILIAGKIIKSKIEEDTMSNDRGYSVSMYVTENLFSDFILNSFEVLDVLKGPGK